jgi:hypothetical protein
LESKAGQGKVNSVFLWKLNRIKRGKKIMPEGNGNVPSRRDFLKMTAGLMLTGDAVSGTDALAMAGKKSGALIPPEMWIVSHNSLTPAEQTFAITLQGLVNQHSARVWMKAGSTYAIVEQQLKKQGVRMHQVKTIEELLKPFRKEAKGAIVCRLHTPSMNVAASLCNTMQGIALDESLLPRAKTMGLPVIMDVRNMDDQTCFDRYGKKFAKGVMVEQTVNGSGSSFLLDYAVSRNAFTYYTKDSDFRTRLAQFYGPDVIAYGWGNDEYQWTESLSRGNATGVAADWNLNLSALQHLPAGTLRRPIRQMPPVEKGVRYVAFVLTDGDNFQWLCGSFVDNVRFWASPLRGQFPMTWEVSPVLARVAPRVLKYIYSTAKDTDGFVTGAGVPGYTYIHYQPDPESIARQAAPMLKEADLPYVGILNANEGDLKETVPLLELPEVQGVLYKDYAPYNRHEGKIFWHNHKPCISFRYMLWENLMSPEQVAAGVAALPSNPLEDENSYAMVTVHAWSYGDIGGPLEAVNRTIKLLPSNTRVITADQLIALMKKNLGDKMGG